MSNYNPDTNHIDNPLQTKLQEVIFELYDIADGETKGSALIRALCREFAQRLETVENRLKCHNLGEKLC